MSDDDLSALWQQQWPGCPPLSHMLNRAFPDRWVRFHSLPESKRYPDHDAEYDVVLHRHNSILDELFQGQDIRIITTHWSDDPEPQAMSPRRARQLPGARHWRSLLDDEDDTDPRYAHLYVDRTTWQPGLLDDLLRDVADEVVADVMITNLSVDRIHAPYDGGADVLLPTTAERDIVKRRHIDWLSVHSHGY
ncbi:hypothetical protein BS329_35780 [Amycolatopsis coloradensis]|uniref:DUF3885 domain-containing protein n=2 Tax=Amycolatopsis coloradensis TaxID=76021 RepID=A0A1R0KGE7_9PSEU|nr:hypothetical protein [Amycolatopsis coloradensis]OLZ44673.1 hypothetical protein BS329_35780 [Amycolatopsis coloradensis]